MQLEVEMKFVVVDPAATRAQLEGADVKLGEPVRQVDTYFAHPARDFRQTDEAFRLRQVGEANYFTYKGPKIDQHTKTRPELEVPLVSGAASAVDYQRLLEALGFRVGGVVAKSRRSGHIEQNGYAIEVLWDSVDRLGSFVELEVLVPESELTPAREALVALAERLQLGGAERRSYLSLLEEKDAEK